VDRCKEVLSWDWCLWLFIVISGNQDLSTQIRHPSSFFTFSLFHFFTLIRVYPPYPLDPRLKKRYPRNTNHDPRSPFLFCLFTFYFGGFAAALLSVTKLVYITFC